MRMFGTQDEGEGGEETHDEMEGKGIWAESWERVGVGKI